MRILIGVLAVLLCANAMSFDESAKFEGVAGIYVRLLTSDNIETIKSGAKSVYRDQIFNEDMLDLVAEVLHESIMDEGKRAQRIDLIAWLARVLGESGNPRYQSTISLLVDSGNKKLVSYGNIALAQLSVSSGNAEFTVTEGLLISLQTKYQQALEASHADKASFLGINIHDDLGTVINNVGMPDELWSEGAHTIRIAQHFRSTFNGLVLAYNDFGLVYFHHNRGGWRVDTVSNIYLLLNDDIGEDSLQLAASILGNSWLETTNILNRNTSKEKQYDELVYDISAEKLYRTMDTHSAYEIKMLTYLAKFIGVGGDPRYINILQEVVDESDSRHIRRHAKRALKALKKNSLSDTEVEQYLPGSIEIGK